MTRAPESLPLDARLTVSRQILDATDVALLSLPAGCREALRERGVHTVADVRRRWKEIVDWHPFRPSWRRILACRLQTSLACEICGAPFVLYESGMLCADAGACPARVIPYANGEEKRRLRRLFPDRISK